MRSSRVVRNSVGALAFAAMLALPGLAAAQGKPAGPDSLTLQDGTVVTGTFTEFVPNNRVTVLSGGESKTFQWNLVRKASHDGKVVAENQQAPAPQVVVVQPAPQQQVVVVQGQAPAQAAPQAALEDQVVVHLEADEDTVLEMQDRSDRETFTPVCHTPCDKSLPLDRMYRVSGDGIKSSRAFKLAGSNGKTVVLDVNPGRKGAFVGGIVMTSVGPVALITGLLVYAAGSITIYGGSVNSSARTTGGILMLAGAAVTAVGIPLLVSNARTKVTQDVGSPARSRDDGKLRLPEWNRDVAHEVPMPSTNYVPVLARSF